ncbi:expressed unknown protein [Seminavis robusta]|uniref:BTB domain-containing protein n=1 Tax=Seminavis robusta TaxID=568900 RepID=A0A9N8I096_9STRA|nr:expressed unknown protein [Seminavis robusta]|eukprot:Sro3584_g349370.1 n/a (369) ;mRNA; f:3728-4834
MSDDDGILSDSDSEACAIGSQIRKALKRRILLDASEAKEDNNLPKRKKPKQEQVSWRDDPVESYSDWKLIVVDLSMDEGNEESVTTYNIHKCMAVSGRHCSDFLAEQFRVARIGENKDLAASTHLELAPALAESVPKLLDYIYGANLKYNLRAKEVVALHSLGHTFKIPSLQKATELICHKKMTTQNASSFYRWAASLKNDKLENVTVKYIVDHILEIDGESDLVCNGEMLLWNQILDHLDTNKLYDNQEDAQARSFDLSILFAKVCKRHIETISLFWFSEVMTDKLVLPHIDPSVAFDFCEMDETLQAKFAPEEDLSFSCLQERCARSIASVKAANKGDMAKHLGERSKAFCVEVILASKASINVIE